MKALVVLPVITPTYADTCIASIIRPDSAFGVAPEDIIIVDNSRDGFAYSYLDLAPFDYYRDPEGHNLGVARSWNLGVNAMLNDPEADYIVLLSASMQFGPMLHCTWRWQMEQFWGAKVIESDGHSWHMIALHRTTFEKIGLFDSNYYPGYFEQTDWCYRLRMVGWEQGFIRVWCNAMSQAVAGHNQVISCPAAPLLAYYDKKWGGPKGEEKWVQPFGNRPLGYFEEEPIPVLAERYGLETWW